MNEMIELLQNHVSVRDYANRLVSEEIKNELVKSAQSTSTSNFV
ncbi:NADPH-dependent oxidoreductase [Enterococcus cecorum]|nr:NADPH-dependent oxidoreductase [Enterococcus cecorum]